jgi:diaminohydroxyphosphoribosylaminopyrimidine deaminase / 5-amino-6-(5-phosphoribosylamino)uracil reductase
MGEGSTIRPASRVGIAVAAPRGPEPGAPVRDDEVMRQAIELARSARRHTAPKPAVGCVIVRDGEVVGTGATEPSLTGAHAEAVALRAAGERARGGTAYTTLEPCNHHGNTPPCTEALIAASVARVVVAVGDPDDRVAGRGYARLTDAGIEVTTHVCELEATHDLAPYLHHRRTGRAFVTAKVASSLDGRVAARDGSSQWITGEAARADAHELRADAQAIVVGAGTAIADRPSLTVRGVAPVPDRPPLRVVLDARGRVPASGPLFETADTPTLVITTEQAASDAVDAWCAAGAKVEVVPASPNGVALDASLELLGGHGVLHALVEGGGTLLGAMVDGGYAQRIVAYVAPTLLGAHGTPSFAFDGPASIAVAPRFALTAVTQLGADVRLDYEVAA